MNAASAKRYFLVGLMLLTGCVKMENPVPETDRAPGVPRTDRALEPGDRDYPPVNPSPSATVEVTVVAPPSIPVELHLNYVVDAQPDVSDPKRWVSRAGCNWTQDAMFHIELVLPLKKSGDTYTGSFSLDHFQGVCGWKLWTVTSPIVWAPIAYFDHSDATNSHPFPDLDLTQNENDFWCTRKHNNQPDTTSSSAHPEIDCTFALNAWRLRGNKWSSIPIPADKLRWNHIATQYIKTMRIEFHDLDELVPNDRPVSAAKDSRPEGSTR